MTHPPLPFVVSPFASTLIPSLDAEKEGLLRTPTAETASSVGDEDASLSQAATRGESDGGKYSQDAIEANSSEGGNAGAGIMMVNAMVSGECLLLLAI